MSAEKKAENVRSKEACEERLLRIAEGTSAKEASLLFLQKQDWDVIRGFHPQRENAAGWLPMKKTDRVLEIGAGCGAVTGRLCRNTGKVTALTASKTLAEAIRVRHAGKGNLTVETGAVLAYLKDISERFDWIVVSDEQELFRDEEALLALLKDRLLPDGKLVLGFYNPYGLMFLSGCADPESGVLFGSLEGNAAGKDGANAYQGSRALGPVKEALWRAGFDRVRTFYPFPTHVMPNRIFSDEFLPTPGELKNDTYSFEHPRIRLFDEQKAWDRILADGEFPRFSNSYFLIAEATWSS